VGRSFAFASRNRLERQSLGINEFSDCPYEFDASGHCQLGDSTGELSDDSLLERPDFRQIDGWRCEFDAPVLGFFCFLNQFGNVKQRLRRNATTMEADSARLRIGVDQRDLHSMVGGMKSGAISAWTA